MMHTIYGLDPEIIPFNNRNIIKENFPKVVDSLLKYQPKALIGFIDDRSPTPFRISGTLLSSNFVNKFALNELF